MIVKMVEIRDRGTMIPAIAIRLGSRNEAERRLLSRGGFGPTNEEHKTYVMLGGWNRGQIQYDPFEWGGGDRTYRVAHQWLIEHFDEIESGNVVDVEFILGETTQSKPPEMGY